MIWIIIWLIGSVFVAGKSFAYWQRGWPEWRAEEEKMPDFLFSIFVFGLIGWWIMIFILLFSKNPSTGNNERVWNYGWTLNYKYPRGKK